MSDPKQEENEPEKDEDLERSREDQEQVAKNVQGAAQSAGIKVLPRASSGGE